MKKKRHLLVTMILAVLLLFTGCSAQDSGSGNNTTNVQNAESTHETETIQQSDTASQRISREEAVRIVLSRVEGAEESNIKELDTDQDDGQFVYEGELQYGGYEYDFEVDGITGEIIKWEIDRE